MEQQPGYRQLQRVQTSQPCGEGAILSLVTCKDMADTPRYKRDVSPEALARARELRRNQTPMEKRLWALLRRDWQGYHWRRQEPVAGYFADFLSYELMLIIELDGSSHLGRGDYDELRDTVLRSQGFSVVRVTNLGIADPNSDAFEKIWRAIERRVAEFKLDEKSRS